MRNIHKKDRQTDAKNKIDVLRSLGRFLRSAVLAAIMVLSIEGALSAGLKVFPRIITPGTPPENENVFFDFTSFDDPKPHLRILDLKGRTVREISTLNPTPVTAGWRLSWNGTDDNGDTVLPGIYIYEWSEGTAVLSGTVVVAR